MLETGSQNCRCCCCESSQQAGGASAVRTSTLAKRMSMDTTWNQLYAALEVLTTDPVWCER